MQPERAVSAARPPTSRKRIVAMLLLVICVAFMGGTIVQEPLAAAGLAAAGFSITVGIFVVAPLAGKHGKRNLMLAFAQPTEEDLLLIQGATGHIVANMSQMAEDPEMQGHFEPICDMFIHSMSKRYEMLVKNLASQRERGVGMFDPQNLMSDPQLAEKFQGQLIERFGGPILDACGFEGESRELAQAWFMVNVMGGKAALKGPENGPAVYHGTVPIGPTGNPGGGWGGV